MPVQFADDRALRLNHRCLFFPTLRGIPKKFFMPSDFQIYEEKIKLY
jgi:hypothetical protein